MDIEVSVVDGVRIYRARANGKTAQVKVPAPDLERIDANRLDKLAKNIRSALAEALGVSE